MIVKTGVVPLEKLVYLMSEAPRTRFDIETDVGFTVFDLDACYDIDPNDFKTKGRATPFENMTVYGKCLMTVYDGKVVFYASPFGRGGGIADGEGEMDIAAYYCHFAIKSPLSNAKKTFTN